MISALCPILLAFGQFVRTPPFGRRITALIDPPTVVHAAGAREGRKGFASCLWSPVESDKAHKGVCAPLAFDL